MGIIDRIKGLAKANINSIIDRAEDPEKMTNQIIRDLQSAITEARNQTVTMIAQQKVLASELTRAQGEIDRHAALAQRAVLGGRDDLAKEALTRKKSAESELGQIRRQYDLQLNAVESLKKNLSAVERQYRDAEARRDAIIARARRAEVMGQAAKVVAKVSAPYDPSSLNQQLDRADRRLAKKEAESEALLEMAADNYDGQFQSLDDPEVLDELQLLKASLLPRQIPATVSNEDDLDTKLFDPGDWDEAEVTRELAELKRIQ